MSHTLSSEQQEILAWFRKDQTNCSVDVDGNLVGRARAGTGKTFIIENGVKVAPETSIINCAFSKVIQLELESRFVIEQNGRKVRTHQHVKNQTIHSLGLGCVRRFRDRINVDFGNTRAESLTDAICKNAVPDAIKKLVTKLHTKARELAPFAKNAGDLIELAIDFECEPEEQWANSGFPLEKVEMLALEVMELAANVQSGATIDGADMLYLPVRNNWIFPSYDLGVVDEAQDLTLTKRIIARGVVKPTGRIAVFGDDRQAIFGFLGADSDSLDNLKAELKAGELGLKTTYRCGHAIVAYAQSYVPDIQAGSKNPSGIVENIHTSELVGEAGPGDFILSRANAPLVGIAIKLLRAGKRTRVMGQDIGKGLTTLVRKLKARSVPDFLQKVSNWEAREDARLRKMMDGATPARIKTIETKIADNQDRATMLEELADGAKNMASIEERIEFLFKDDGLGVAGIITCSSIHKAKGLEAKKIFVLEDTLRYHDIEEQNIVYVAITRAKEHLVWVGDNNAPRN